MRAGARAAIDVAVQAAAPGDRVGGVLEVPAGECLLVLSRSSGTVDDLDLFLYGEDGSVLGTDESAEKDATALVCPPHPRHVYISARVAAGHGVVAVVAHPVPTDAARAVASEFGVRHGDVPGRAADAWPELETAMAERRRTLGGHWQSRRRVVLPVDSRVPTRVSTPVEGNSCLDVLVVPSEEVAQLDVVALDDRGRIVARAPSVGRERGLVLCATLDTPVTLELRPHVGNDVVALMLSRSLDSVADVSPGTGRVDLVPTAPLGSARDTLDRALAKRGFEASKHGHDGALETGRRQSLPLDLASGCNRLDIVLGAPSLGVDAWLWDRDDRLVASGGGSAHATLYACTARGPARLDLEPVSRAGPYRVDARLIRRAPKELSELPLAASRVLGKLDGVVPLDGTFSGMVLHHVHLRAAEIHRLPVRIQPGRCTLVAAATDHGASGTEVRIVDETAALEVDRARGYNSASARACAPVTAAISVVAEVQVATGEADAFVVIRELQ